MRVVQVLGPSTGGIGVYVRALAAYCVGEGDDVRIVPVDLRRHPARIRGLRRRLLTERPDVVHAHGFKAAVAVNLALAGVRRSRAPRRVVTLHNAVGARLVETLAVRPADVVLGASADLVERARALGARESAFVPVPAPQLPPPSRSKPELRAEFGLDEDELLLLSVGRLAAQKSMSVLLDAVELLEKPPVHLVIAGDGPEHDALAARIAARRLPVTLLGQRTDVADLLAAADVFVLASRWEARALVVQEALRAGVPVVATAVGGLPELVGDAAVLVPWNDARALAEAVRALAADPRERERLAAAGRARAATWPDATEALALARGWYC
ncbi:glycosyltransferase family 4 protein [Actinospica durhamensis]|uniref:Glycosyltransferase family 4 protein n=1 Tax=Actinospica durhamensis TaxID=1508375 RepID=A0A941IWE2_9ACTN|nr:glycosyltransferase family 4 protein [Actinospica durhamensis]MBR7839201.1 glycosyltransferase family 4 protein [Actinospica durhamensis]